ncbi:hypothetical protein N8381_03615 [Oceanospirillaceae bacterium]|nr:hypothetical protein [Oceanospirillaceae bacterium]
MGEIAPLFPGQIGVLYISLIILINYAVIKKNKYLAIITFVFSALLYKKYLLIYIIFLSGFRFHFLGKVVLSFIALLFYIFVDVIRNNLNLSELVFYYSSYYGVSMANFLYIIENDIQNHFSMFNQLFALPGENVVLIEPTAGPGYVGGIFLSAGVAYGIGISVLMGVGMAFVSSIMNNSYIHNALMKPLMYFSILMTVQGNVFFNYIMFIIPFFVVLIFSRVFGSRKIR